MKVKTDPDMRTQIVCPGLVIAGNQAVHRRILPKHLAETGLCSLNSPKRNPDNGATQDAGQYGTKALGCRLHPHAVPYRKARNSASSNQLAADLNSTKFKLRISAGRPKLVNAGNVFDIASPKVPRTKDLVVAYMHGVASWIRRSRREMIRMIARSQRHRPLNGFTCPRGGGRKPDQSPHRFAAFCERRTGVRRATVIHPARCHEYRARNL